jgi:hypothetical protein
MLNRLDDYPVHQTAEPLAHPATGDRNAYDRYFFNGYTREGDLFFAVALGVYPNRRVMDAAVSVVRGGEQISLHASRLSPAERTETRVGPIELEVLDPMRSQRLRIAPNETGLSGELRFDARTSAVEEPRFTMRAGTRIVMDSTRFAQFGTWSGQLVVDDREIELRPTEVLGCRDRSWGVRGVGERDTGGAPPDAPPQFFWLWAPLNFDDGCTHLGINEHGDGRKWHQNGRVIPLLEGPDASLTDESGVERMASVDHEIKWAKGTRRAASARLWLRPEQGEPRAIELEPILNFQMVGIGYGHPEWGHGVWKGELATGGERTRLADLDPLDPRHLHVQALCRARMGARRGIGVLEQLVIGPHAPSGFRSFLDGAS